MLTRFIFVRSTTNFQPDDVIYHVWVGSSRKDAVQAALIREFANDCGLYWRKYDENVCQAITCLAESLFPGHMMPRIMLRSCSISVQELYSLIINDGFSLYEKNLKSSHAKIQLLHMIAIADRNVNVIFNRITGLQAGKRKNLCHSNGSSLSSTALKAALVVFLFLLTGWLEGHECLFF